MTMWRRKERLDLLKFLFPKYLLLLAMLPLITGMFVDKDLVHPISFLVNLLWMLPFTFPYYIFRKRFIYSLAATYYFVIGFFEIGHWLVLDGPLTISSLLNFFNSNLEEVTAYMSLKFNFKLLLLIPFVLLFIIALRNPPKVRYYRIKFKNLALIVIVFVTIGLILFKIYPKTQLVPQFAKVFYATAVELKAYNLAIAENRLQRVDAAVEGTQNGQTFVLILGESCSRNHMSLYGCPVNTNPRLSKREDLVVFNETFTMVEY